MILTQQRAWNKVDLSSLEKQEMHLSTCCILNPLIFGTVQKALEYAAFYVGAPLGEEPQEVELNVSTPYGIKSILDEEHAPDDLKDRIRAHLKAQKGYCFHTLQGEKKVVISPCSEGWEIYVLSETGPPVNLTGGVYLAGG